MVISVMTAEGAHVDFPDNTDGPTIDRVMRQATGESLPLASGWHLDDGGATRGAGPQKPAMGTPEYAAYMAQKHGVAPEHVSALVNSQVAGEGLQGIPVLGGLVNKAGAGISALTGAGASGGSIKERYGKNKALEDELTGDFEAQRPVTSTAAQIAGGIASTGGLGGTTLGARLLGMGGRTLLQRSAAGAASGAGIGALDALTRGQDPTLAGEIGGAVGGAVPAVSRVAQRIAEPIINTVRGAVNPAAQAERNVAGALVRDTRAGDVGLTAQDYATAAQTGQIGQTRLMDVGGETTRALARSAANTSPEARGMLNRAIDDRFQSQSDRFSDWLNSTFHYPNAAAQREALDQVRQTTLRPLYDQAMADGAGQVRTPELERLAGSDTVSAAMKRAMSSWRDEAIMGGQGGMNAPKVWFNDSGVAQFTPKGGGPPVFPDLQFWDLTRRELSGMASTAYRQGDATLGRRYSTFADAINQQLDAAVPSYRAARGTAATFFGASDALDAGEKFVGSTMPIADARQALSQMSPTEQQLFQDGFVSKLIARTNELGLRQNIGLHIANSPDRMARLEVALGPQRAGELQTYLHIESVMDRMRGAVQGNSTTARQLIEAGLVGGAAGEISGDDILHPDPVALITGMLIKGAHGAVGQRINTNVARQVATLLTSTDPNRVRTGIQLVSRNPAMSEAVRMADQVTSHAIGTHVNIQQGQQEHQQ